MEADWEFEVGGDAPVIDALWPGFVDLRLAPERAWSLPEVRELPGLAAALERLNADSSPVWTAKCDFWPEVELDAVDADELDAPSGEFAYAMGCYVDLLAKADRQWATPPIVAESCKQICGRLHAAPQRCCRVDLIVRRAVLSVEEAYLGITAYLTACGATAQAAKLVLEAALAAFADALVTHSKLQ